MSDRIYWGKKEQVKGSFMASTLYDSWSVRVPFSYDGQFNPDTQKRIESAIQKKHYTDPRFGRSYSVVTIDPVGKVIVVKVQQKV